MILKVLGHGRVNDKSGAELGEVAGRVVVANILSCKQPRPIGWVLFFSRHYFPHTWDKPLLAAASMLIGMKLGAFILLSAAAFAVKAFRWLRPN
jgi:hypothetical protein